MPVYKRKLKRGTFWYYMGRHRKVRYWSEARFRTEAQAKRAEREELDRIDEQLDNPQTDMGFYDLCQRRLDYLKTASTKTYYRHNRDTLKRALNFFDDVPVSQITRSMVQDFLVERANDLQEKGYDLYGVNKDIRHLKACFNYGADELEADIRNPVRKIKFFAVEQAVKYIPPDADIAAVLLKATPFQQAYILTIKNSLARSIEINRLKVEDVDFHNGQVRLWTKKARSQNLTSRLVGMNSELRSTLEGWFKRRNKRNPFVFYDSLGQMLGYQRWLRGLCLEAEVQPFTFHSLRHRGASLLLKEKKTDIHTLMEILGHNNLTTTQRYIQSLKSADGNQLEGI